MARKVKPATRPAPTPRPGRTSRSGVTLHPIRPDTEATTTSKPIRDVAQPGTSAPDDTSKAIIVHRPMLQDPMVAPAPAAAPKTVDEGSTAEPDAAPTAKAAPLKSPADKPQLQPPAAAPIPEGPAAQEPASSSPGAPAEADTPDTPDVPHTPQTPHISSDTDTGEAEIAIKPGDVAAVEAEDAAREQREAAVQQLIDSKKYVLPIKTVEQRRSRRFIMLGTLLALALALAWLNIALDAGLIQLGGLQPLTHFFSD